ncbi:MAG: TonB-dependent receptor [Halieaceae bacterium]
MTYLHPQRTVLAAAVATALCASLPAQAQETIEEVLVTGSKIRQAALDRSSPVNTLTKDDLERVGMTSVADILNQLPNSGGALNTRFNSSGNFGFPPDGGGIGAGAAQVDLRNLGSKRTLVLVDGIRWVNGSSASGVSSATDLNTIPLSVIDRIEVLEDGASAIYGSDAIAGVVNIITKKKFEGIEINAYGGQWDDEDGETEEYSLSWGVQTNTTNVFFGASYNNQEDIRAKDRDISGYPVAGLNRCLGNCSSGTPQGRFVLTDPNTNNVVDLTTNDGVSGIPAYDPANPGGGTDDFHGFATEDRFNYSQFNLVMAPVERWNIFTQISHEFSPNVRANVKGMYNNRESTNQAAPEPLFIGPDAGNGNLMDTVSVDVTNPYNPFGFSVDADSNAIFMGRRPLEAGPRIFNQDVDTFYISGGLDGSFEFADRSFFWDVTAAYSKNEANQQKHGAFNSAHIKRALGPLDECTDNCVPLNFFGGQGGDGSGTITQDMIDYVGFIQKDESEQELTNYLFNLSGTVMDLPAGALGFAVGYEYRDQEGSFTPDPVVTAGESAGVPSLPTSGSYDVDEFFLELNVPLLKDQPFANELELSYALRYSDYETIGSDDTNKFGVRWKPIEDLMFRATWSEGFRAPGIGELFGSAARFDQTIDDPCSGIDASTPQNIVDNCGALGVPTDGSYTQFNAQISVTTGGNEDLDEETSDNTMYGMVYAPSWVDNVSWIDGIEFEVNYFDIEVDDAIQALDAQVQLSGCVASLDASLCEGISRTPSGVINGFSNKLTNIGGIETEGYDFTITYASPDTKYGAFTARWQGTNLDSYTESIPTENGFVDLDLEGTEKGDPERGFPEFKSNLYLDWRYGNWHAGWTMRYIDELTERCPDIATGENLCSNEAAGKNKLDDVLYNDVQVTWTPDVSFGDVSLQVGANNLFDEDPPECYSCALNGFDATLYDVPGVFYYARLVYRQE